MALILLVTANLASSLDYEREVLNLEVKFFRNDSKPELLNFTHGEGQTSDYTYFEPNYRIISFDESEEKLFSGNFTVSFYLTDVDVPPRNSTIRDLRIPYSEDVSKIKVDNLYGKDLTIELGEFCNNNGKCEPKLGENYENCSSDCSVSSNDNYCTGLNDGVCDPDCEPDQDPDCESRYEDNCYENGECETEKGESFKTCPSDCSSGIADGYCDGVKDGKCDPDCTEDEDPDCGEEESGDGEGADEICNENGECEPGRGENYINCPTDCEQETNEEGIPIWVYGVIGGIVVLVIVIMFTSTKVEE